MGAGSPTVILESGFGVGSLAWGRAQGRIAQVTRVCAYDRAGYGFSDPGPLPRDGAAIARDLDRGLRSAGIRGPYVVVGHSAGGLYARLFAARRRRDIIGLIFVDTSVEHQTQRFAALFGAGVGSLEGVRHRAADCLAATEAPAHDEGAAARAECLQRAGGAGVAPGALYAPFWRTELSELDTLFDATSSQVDRVGALLHDVPAIVLTAADSDGPRPEAEAQGAVAWQRFHGELAASFDHGEQRLVKSSHLMMNDRPEVVAEAAIALTLAARKR